MNTFLDSFSGSVYELKPKQKGNPMIVLSVLSKDPNVSTWDMDSGKRYPLWKTIDKLKEMGYIEEIPCNYPWRKYVITESGKLKLELQEKEF